MEIINLLETFRHLPLLYSEIGDVHFVAIPDAFTEGIELESLLAAQMLDRPLKVRDYNSTVMRVDSENAMPNFCIGR